jgi:polyhydroxyalkanoate synthase
MAAQRKAKKARNSGEPPASVAQKPERRGPRPLALHLTMAQLAWSSLRAALPALGAGPAAWPSTLAREAASLRDELLADAPSLAGQDPANLRSTLTEAIDRAGERRLLAFTAGVRAYRAHPYRRTLADPPAIWRDGTTRLLDYGASAKKSRGRARGAVLVIPSLVNRGTVLDLTADSSLMRHLASQGFRPLLVDWDAPGPAEKTFGLDEYVADRLEGALDAAVAAHGGPVALLGYCMGGNLALALALRRPQDVAGLACLATPWDFQADGPFTAPLDAVTAAQLAATIEAMPEFPIDLLQAMFASLDPFLVNRKYRSFGTGGQERGRDELFVAIEDWVNDGMPLASKVASQCLVGWYGENAPALGQWWVAGQAVDPARLRCPALVIIPARDRIVPPASAMALATAIPHAECLSVPSGHVAMIVGDQAPRLTWQPLVAWLSSLAVPAAAKRSRSRGTRRSA